MSFFENLTTVEGIWLSYEFFVSCQFVIKNYFTENLDKVFKATIFLENIHYLKT